MESTFIYYLRSKKQKTSLSSSGPTHKSTCDPDLFMFKYYYPYVWDQPLWIPVRYIYAIRLRFPVVLQTAYRHFDAPTPEESKRRETNRHGVTR